MKKLGIFVFLFIIGLFSVYAQDLIILRDGNIIESRVQEISPAEIRYKRFDHLDGPTIVLPINNVLSIRYQNGRVETFNAASTAPTAQTPMARQPQTAGQATQQPTLIQEVASQLGVNHNTGHFKSITCHSYSRKKFKVYF